MIHIEPLQYAVGDFRLRDVSLRVEEGEYFVLLGKPGSGKTILLECIAGLRAVSAGAITLHGRRVEHSEPGQRGIGYVPQDYALFATRTVWENIEFGLVVRRVPRAERKVRVDALAEMLGIPQLLHRAVHGLSGGEMQRVALARALAPEPGILLLDEPVSALDRETSNDILSQLTAIQRGLGTTIVHVCHDLDEMLSVADRVGIMEDGSLVQAGTPGSIRRAPAREHVARLFDLGTVLCGVTEMGPTGAVIRVGDLAVPAPEGCEGEVKVLIRADAVGVTATGDRARTVSGSVRSVLWREAVARVQLEVGSTRLRADVTRHLAESLRLGDHHDVGIVVPPEAVYVLDSPRRTDGS